MQIWRDKELFVPGIVASTLKQQMSQDIINHSKKSFISNQMGVINRSNIQEVKNQVKYITVTVKPALTVISL